MLLYNLHVERTDQYNFPSSHHVKYQFFTPSALVNYNLVSIPIPLDCQARHAYTREHRNCGI